MTATNDQIISNVRNWLEEIVIGLNLCPFAKRELHGNRVRFVVSAAHTEEQLLDELAAELAALSAHNPPETTLLIHPFVLDDFSDFNQFLNFADALLIESGLQGVCQIAHFHPSYQFANTEKDDAENYTNRSPYPILHILREESLDRVLRTTEFADQIPSRNIRLMNRLGAREMQRRLDALGPENAE